MVPEYTLSEWAGVDVWFLSTLSLSEWAGVKVWFLSTLSLSDVNRC